MQHFDLVHIDDDSLVRMSWQFVAKKSGKSVLSLASKSELLEQLANLAKDTPFYIDSHLGEGEQKGELLAKELYEQGFENLYLSTGYEPSEFAGMDWIRKVVGKEPGFLQ